MFVSKLSAANISLRANCWRDNNSLSQIKWNLQSKVKKGGKNKEKDFFIAEIQAMKKY